MDFCLRVSATVSALPKYHGSRGVFFLLFVCLFIYLFIYFQKLKSKIFEIRPVASIRWLGGGGRGAERVAHINSPPILLGASQITTFVYNTLTFFGWYGLSDTLTRTWSWGLNCLFVVLLFSSYCCRWLQIIFISGLFFDSDCFSDYTGLCVTSAWFYPR